MKALFKSSKFRFTLKLTFVAALFYFLGKKGFLSLEATKNALGQLNFVIPGILAMVASTLIGVYRWHLLLKTQTIRLRPSRTFQLALIGNFFNIALPGAVSGDVVKAIYVAKEVKGKRAWALSSILFDRVAGVSALIVVSAGALAASLSTDWAAQLIPAVRWMVAGLAFGTLSFYVYLMLVDEHRDPLLILFKKLETRFKMAGSFVRIYEGIRHYRIHRGTVVFTLILSTIIHLLVTYACLNFAWALGVTEVPTLAVFIIVPIGLLFTAIPIMPGGVGTGHAAFLALFHFLGSQRGADVFNLLLLFNLSLGGLGGLIYLRFKSENPVSLDFPENGETAPTT